MAATAPSGSARTRHSTRRFAIAGCPVEHRLYFAREAYTRYFAMAFAFRAAYGLGALRPPHTVRRLPRELWERFRASAEAKGEQTIDALRRALELYIQQKQEPRP